MGIVSLAAFFVLKGSACMFYYQFWPLAGSDFLHLSFARGAQKNSYPKGAPKTRKQENKKPWNLKEAKRNHPNGRYPKYFSPTKCWCLRTTELLLYPLDCLKSCRLFLETQQTVDKVVSHSSCSKLQLFQLSKRAEKGPCSAMVQEVLRKSKRCVDLFGWIMWAKSFSLLVPIDLFSKDVSSEAVPFTMRRSLAAMALQLTFLCLSWLSAASRLSLYKRKGSRRGLFGKLVSSGFTGFGEYGHRTIPQRYVFVPLVSNGFWWGWKTPRCGQQWLRIAAGIFNSIWRRWKWWIWLLGTFGSFRHGWGVKTQVPRWTSKKPSN